MEVQAHHDLMKASVQNSYLVIGGKYQLALLSARPDLISQDLEKALLEWLWDKEGGICYLSVILSSYNRNLSSGELDRWFSSMELLSRFNNWRGLDERAIQWLWRQQTPDGLWILVPGYHILLSFQCRKNGINVPREYSTRLPECLFY